MWHLNGLDNIEEVFEEEEEYEKDIVNFKTVQEFR